jgi:hypothetical protein
MKRPLFSDPNFHLFSFVLCQLRSYPNVRMVTEHTREIRLDISQIEPARRLPNDLQS